MHLLPHSPRVLAGIAIVALAGSLTACGSSEPSAPAATDSVASQDPTDPSVKKEPAEIEPLTLNASGLLGGDAGGLTFDTGQAGAVSVVLVGTPDPDAGTLPIVFRNGTDAAVSHVDVAATARDAAGALVATGSSQGTTTAQVAPGGVGLAYVFFDTDATLTPETVYEFTFETSEADTSSYNTSDLKITEANRVGSAIVGSAVNHNDAAVTGPYSADVYCFDAGALTSTHRSFADQDSDLEPGGAATFTVDLFDVPCATYVVGVTGYFA